MTNLHDTNVQKVDKLTLSSKRNLRWAIRSKKGPTRIRCALLTMTHHLQTTKRTFSQKSHVKTERIDSIRKLRPNAEKTSENYSTSSEKGETIYNESTTQQPKRVLGHTTHDCPESHSSKELSCLHLTRAICSLKRTPRPF